MIENISALDKIKKLKDNSQDFIFGDPPYLLGSTVKIGKDGKPYYEKARDFMNAWDGKQVDEKFWEEFFFEADRVLKFGGRILFFGIDRQLFLFQYYAVAAGFEIKQSLYWYFISNFPKATDLSKQIDKRLGVDREVVGIKNNTYDGANRNPENHVSPKESSKIGEWGLNETPHGQPLTESNTELGKKYEGYKYSISPLKQVLETVMVFQKRTKNKSILDDVFAFENGDKTISPSIWAIDEGRVGIDGGGTRCNNRDEEGNCLGHKDENGRYSETKHPKNKEGGRYPSQMFIDSTCASKIDEQSGELTSGARKSSYTRNATNPNDTYGTFNKNQMDDAEKDTGGASRILHHIGYLDEELDLVFYSPKVSTFEREHGCGDIEKKEKVFNGCSETSSVDIKDVEARFTTAPTSNNHPTLKPIKLIYQIAKLLKAPFPQNIFFPFSGAGSEIIGFEQAGFNPELFEMSELDADFCNIAETRRKAWRNLDITKLDENKKHIEKRRKEHKKQEGLFDAD